MRIEHWQPEPWQAEHSQTEHSQTEHIQNWQTEHWQRVGQVFDAALERTVIDRAQFLDQACTGHPEVRREVERLLEHDRQASSFLEDPFFSLGAAAARAEHRLPREGDRFGPYKLVRNIRQGGMGSVFLAVRDDDQFQQQVAIKLVRHGLESSEMLHRFRRERQILARLSHPNIARLYDGGTSEDGQPFLVMEYIDGLPLTEHCDQHQLSISQRLELFRQVCSAVQYAHQNLLVHRDIKPSNILVVPDGTPKLLDFGIAKLLDPAPDDNNHPPTAPRQRVMTLDYASPEQVRGEAVTTASDVYALGALLYELLTGRSPYRLTEGLPHELERAICQQEPERPSLATTGEQRRRLRGDLDTIVSTALRKEPARRYSSAEQLSRDIQRHLDELPVNARADTLGYRTTKFFRRHRLSTGITFSFLLVVIALVSSFIVTVRAQSQRVTLERDRAERVSSFLVDLFAVSNPSETVGNSVTARELLDQGARRISRELATQPLAQASMLGTMGRIYRRIGLLSEAEPLLDQALELWRREHGDEHPEVAGGLNEIGIVAMDLGDMERSEALLREALAMRRRLLGDSHPDVATTLADLATLRRGQFDFTEAEPLLREAVAIRQSLPASEPQLAETLNQLARLLLEKGDTEEGEIHLREALRLRRETFGDDHPVVAEGLSQLGNLHIVRGELELAAASYREALEIRRRVLGDEHPLIADSLNDLGGTLGELGQYDAAETHLRESLRVWRGLQKKDPVYVSTVLNNLGQVLRDKGDLEEALAVLLEARATRLRIFGDNHPMVAMNSFALARLYHQQKDFDRAQDLYEEAIRISSSRLPPGHQALAYPRVALAGLLLDRGEVSAAETLVRQSLDSLRASHAEGHWRIADAESLLGGCLTARGLYREAEPLVVSSHNMLKAQRSPRAPTTRRARVRVSELYRAWGKPEKAL